MIHKPEAHRQAIALRKKGKSIREIGKILNLASSTVSLWVRNTMLTPSQKQKLARRVFNRLQQGRKRAQKVQRKIRLKNKRLLESEAIRELGKLTMRDLFIIGIALYWGEGFKKDSRLGFASSDPAMIKVFLDWLRLNGVSIKDIRLRVGLNKSHEKRIKEVEEYWSKEINIPLVQFQKPFFQKFKWKKEFPNVETYFGVLRIRAVNQGPLFIKIKKWLEKLRKSRYNLKDLAGRGPVSRNVS